MVPVPANWVGEAHNAFVDGICDAAVSRKIGYGLDESTQMGPVKDAAKKKTIIGYIDQGVREGAVLRLDGRQEININGDYPKTCFLGPTIFENVTPDMVIAKEEIFGPVMTIFVYNDDDFEETLKMYVPLPE